MLRATRLLRNQMFGKATTGQSLSGNAWKTAYVPNSAGLFMVMFWAFMMHRAAFAQMRSGDVLREEQAAVYQPPDPKDFKDLDYQTGSAATSLARSAEAGKAAA